MSFLCFNIEIISGFFNCKPEKKFLYKPKRRIQRNILPLNCLLFADMFNPAFFMFSIWFICIILPSILKNKDKLLEYSK